jgi:multiple sugar transport system ATP-binding protein
VVLNAGNVEQYGSPLELYERPANLFVAGFIGSPKMNFIGGRIAEQYGAATIGVRPEHIQVLPEGDGWQGTIGVAEHLGSDTFLYVDCGEAGTLTARVVGELGLREGGRVALRPDPARVHRFNADGKALAHEAPR